MARIARHLMTRPGARKCPYCRHDLGEFPAYCHPCDWQEQTGAGHQPTPDILLAATHDEHHDRHAHGGHTMEAVGAQGT